MLGPGSNEDDATCFLASMRLLAYKGTSKPSFGAKRSPQPR